MKQSINTMLTRSFVKYNVFLVILLLPFLSLKAQTPNERQARRIFNHTYDMVFGDKGSSLSYAVNIIHLYKTAGRIWMKGKKSVFEEERYIGYTDEKYYYRVDQKKKTVEIFDVDSPDKDKYASKVKFDLEEFVYHIAAEDDNYVITLDLKKGAKGTVKHAKAYINKKTRYPVKLRLKVLFFWITVDINSFHYGLTDETVFDFPANKFSSYKTEDKRVHK